MKHGSLTDGWESFLIINENTAPQFKIQRCCPDIQQGKEYLFKFAISYLFRELQICWLISLTLASFILITLRS